ncbi:hypothetical protein [Gluconacetobacter entanii]|uniref:hypothetical protein n=1 Tax=Gluconacetobacter entanii TaxID=108528 RepID=UPI0011B785DE|nr:hypothetical protein [Gluconacetobacter entanii]
MAPSNQFVLDLGIEIQKDVNGIEMGVLDDGTPFLTQTGLAKISGAVRSAIFAISQEWEDHYKDEVLTKDRISFIKEYLFNNGYRENKLYIEIQKDGSIHYAYPDVVCMAILEYYAFESRTPSSEALKNYRRLSTYGFRKFIYDALNYTPQDKWKYFHDRVTLLNNAPPDGYFIIFNESTGLIVDLINSGLTVNHKTIPDISVGKGWGIYWDSNGLDKKFGVRVKYEHNYPSYYPQAASNPQKPWAYPNEALHYSCILCRE